MQKGKVVVDNTIARSISMIERGRMLFFDQPSTWLVTAWCLGWCCRSKWCGTYDKLFPTIWTRQGAVLSPFDSYLLIVVSKRSLAPGWALPERMLTKVVELQKPPLRSRSPLHWKKVGRSPFRVKDEKKFLTCWRFPSSLYLWKPWRVGLIASTASCADTAKFVILTVRWSSSVCPSDRKMPGDLIELKQALRLKMTKYMISRLYHFLTYKWKETKTDPEIIAWIADLSFNVNFNRLCRPNGLWLHTYASDSLTSLSLGQIPLTRKLSSLSGVVPAISTAIQASPRKGCTVINTPVYPPFRSVKLQSSKIDRIHLDEKDFQIDWSAGKRYCGARG